MQKRPLNYYPDFNLRYPYSVVYILFVVIFALLLYKPIMNSYFEDDAGWILTTMLQHTLGRGFLKGLISIIPLSFRLPVIEIIPVNMYVYTISSLFGPQAKYLIFADIIVLLFCSLLLFSLLNKRLSLDFRSSFFSALIFLCLFLNHGSYMWPIFIVHLSVVCFLLLVLNLYFKTNQLISEHRPYRFYYVLTLFFNLLASFSRGSILILPFVLLMHILFVSVNKWERFNRFKLWFPLFATYLFYLPLRFAFGESRISLYTFLPAFVPRMPIFAKFLIFFIGGFTFLLLLVFLLKVLTKCTLQKSQVRSFIFILALAVGARSLYPHPLNRIGALFLLPYKLMLLFAGIENTFLFPLKTWIIATLRWSRINLYLAPFSVIFSFIPLIIVVAQALRSKNKDWSIFIFWYLFCLFFVDARPGLNYHQINSRYFIYSTPVFCFVFSVAAVEAYGFLARRFRLGGILREAILILGFACFLIPNILAIRLSIFQNKLTNNFLSYDYIKFASLVKHDLSQKNTKRGFEPEGLCVEGIRPVPFVRFWQNIYDPLRFDALKYVFVQAFDDRRLLGMQVNTLQPKQARAHCYWIEGQNMLNPQGVNIDLFSRNYEQGVQALLQGRSSEAFDFLNAAQATRPFFLNFMLGGLPLEDLFWITANEPLRSWVARIPHPYDDSFERTPTDIDKEFGDRKIEYNFSLINSEILDFSKCLFYLAFLEDLKKNKTRSRELFFQIAYLDKEVMSYEFWKEELRSSLSLQQQVELFLIGMKPLPEARDAEKKGGAFWKFMERLLTLS